EGVYCETAKLKDRLAYCFARDSAGMVQRNKLVFHGVCLPLAQEKAFATFVGSLFRQGWVVYAKPPFGGPEHVLHYLARYTHRVAISNHRLISMEDGKVTFRWKDYAHGGKKRKMILSAEEFIRRFLLHVLPKGLVRIRHYGWMANRCRRECAALCRALLGLDPPSPTSNGDLPVRRCPSCGGTIEIVEVIFPREFLRRRLSRSLVPDTS